MFTFIERGEYLHRNIQTKGERRKKKESSTQRASTLINDSSSL